jgi:hypothetical protein
MLFWLIKIITMSIILILLIHHIIHFLKSTFTIPKTKDLVTTTQKSYENIYNTINTNNTSAPNTSDTNKEKEFTLISSLPTDPTLNNDLKNDLKTELKNFIKENLATST